MEKECLDYRMIIENKEEELRNCKENMERFERSQQRLIEEMNETHEYKLRMTIVRNYNI